MDETVAGLVGAGIGAVAALAGGVISPLLSRQQEHRQWLRDKRSGVLERLLIAIDGARISVAGLMKDVVDYGPDDEDGGNWDQAEFDAAISVRQEQDVQVLSRLRDVLAIARVYLSMPLRESVSELVSEYQSLLEDDFSEDPDNLFDRGKEWLLRLGPVHDLVRKELHVPVGQ